MNTENSIWTVLLSLGKASNPLPCTTEVLREVLKLIPPTNVDNSRDENKKELNMDCFFAVYKNQMFPPEQLNQKPWKQDPDFPILPEDSIVEPRLRATILKW